MHEHVFDYEGNRYRVQADGSVTHHFRGEKDTPRLTMAALCAEILRLAEERDRFKNSYAKLSAAYAHREEGHLAEVEAHMAENRELRDRVEYLLRSRERLAQRLDGLLGDTHTPESLTAELEALRAQVAEQARTIDRLREEARMSRDVAEAALAEVARLKEKPAIWTWTSRQQAEIQELTSTVDSLYERLKRRKAKIRKLRARVRELDGADGIPLMVARMAGAMDERKAVLAYLEGQVGTGQWIGLELVRDTVLALASSIRHCLHLTAPAASQPQAPEPEQRSAPE